MRITESQLRSTIRKVLKEFSAAYGSRYSALDNQYTDFTHQEPTKPISSSLRKQVADQDIEAGICPACHGKGYVMGKDCRMCDGTGETEID